MRFGAGAGAVVVLCAGGSALAGSIFENTVNTFGVLKTGHFVQVDASTVGTQSFDFLAAFTEQDPPDHNVQLADFKYTNMDGIENSVGMVESSPGAWRWDDPTMFGNEAAMDLTYTSANDYIFRLTVDGLGAFEEPIDGPTDLYPDVVPSVNNYTALQMADPSGPISILFDGFADIGSLNQVKAYVLPSGGGTVVWNAQGAHTDTSLMIPGGTLDPNESYDLYLSYETFQNYNDRTSVFPDALAAFTFAYETRVSLVTIPSGGAAGVLGVFGLMAAARRRRA